jgi:SAM-dependent methyltransferase
VDAPARTLAFLTSSTFPLSPTYTTNEVAEASLKSPPSVLDLGTGNGSTLFQLRLSGNFSGPMLGVDYSPKSIQLARALAKRYASTYPARNQCAAIQFEVLDLIHDDPTTQPWWPSDAGGFDLVLDKGTFDAISLSSEAICSANGRQRQACEVYPGRVVGMVKPGGFLFVTSCNWTEEEVLHWFTKSEGTLGRLQVWGNVKYPKYKFGGQEGQGVASICFRRVG